jgi:outer membrane receptor protein involved in Fe transport
MFSSVGSSTVGLYLDEAPVHIRSLEVAGNLDVRVADIDRVEVMRGPQGVLFGAGSLAGRIRLFTRAPSLDTWQGNIEGELGLTEGGGVTRAVQGGVSLPIVDGRAGLRLSGYYRYDAGSIDRVLSPNGIVSGHNVDAMEVTAVRAKARILVGSTLELTPTLLIQRGYRRDMPFFDSSLRPLRQSSSDPQPGRDDFLLSSMVASLDLGKARLVSVTSFLDRKQYQTMDYSRVFGELMLDGAMPGLRVPGGSASLTRVTQNDISQEVRLISTERDAPFKWILGGYFRRSHLVLGQSVTEPGIAGLLTDFLGRSVEDVFGVPMLPGGVSFSSTQMTNEWQLAGFGHLQWMVRPHIELSMGLRVESGRIAFSQLSDGPFVGGPRSSGRIVQHEVPVTPSTSLSYRSDGGTLIYLSASKGFRSGGSNGPVPAGNCARDLAMLGRKAGPAGYDADSAWTYELGIKASLGASRGRAALHVFQIDWQNIQQLVSLPGCGFSYVDNLGTARNRGFEASVEFRPFHAVRVNLGLGFVDARFREHVAAAGEAGSRLVSAGDRLPYVPRWTGAMGAEYAFRPARLVGGYIRSEYRFASRFWRAPSTTSVTYDPRVYAGDATGNLLARAGLSWSHWEISIFGENLLNDDAILYRNGDFVPVTGVPLREMTRRPRTIGITGRATF